MLHNAINRSFYGVAMLFCIGISLCSCLKQRVDKPVIVNPDSTNTTKVSYKERAAQVYNDVVKKYFSQPGQDLFTESFPLQGGDPGHSYFWPYTGVFTGAVLLKQTGIAEQRINSVLKEVNQLCHKPVGNGTHS